MSRSLASDARALIARARTAVAAFPAWVGGILTGLQGAVLSLMLVLVPALGIAASAPAAQGTVGPQWASASGTAVSLWLLAHGAPLELELATITLVPWGMTVVAAAIMAGVARRFTSPTWGSAALAVTTYAAVVGAVSAARGNPTSVTVEVAVVAAMIGSLGTAIGVYRAHGVPLSGWERLPAVVRTGLVRGAAVMAVFVAAAAAVTVLWTWAGRHRLGGIASSLDLDWLGALVLGFAQLAYVPVMVMWALAWLTGRGFSVGEGSFYAPDAVVEGALPAMPIAGVLPTGAGGLLGWVPALLVVGAVAIRVVRLPRRLPSWDDVKTDGVASTVVVVASAGLLWASTGSAGPGRLAEVGPDVIPVVAMLAALTVLGLALGTGAQAVAAVLTRAADNDDQPADNDDQPRDSEPVSQGTRTPSSSSTS